MNIAVIDDISADADKIKKAVSGYYADRKIQANVSLFPDGETFCREYKAGTFQLIFMDIYMKQMTGMEVAFRIREAGDNCNLIFVTSSSEFAVQSYDVHADYYLLKPFSEEKLCKILDQLEIRSIQDSRYIEVISDRTPVRVPVKSILFADTYRNAVQLHTDAGLIRTYLTFQKFEELISEFECFLSCYRGCIVNMDRIQEAQEERFLMDNGEIVQIRKRGSNAIRKMYLQYLFSSDF